MKRYVFFAAGHLKCKSASTLTICEEQSDTITCDTGQVIAIETVQFGTIKDDKVQKCMRDHLPRLDTRSCMDARQNELEQVSTTLK